MDSQKHLQLIGQNMQRFSVGIRDKQQEDASPRLGQNTIIDQGGALDFYFQKYPEDPPVFGFFTCFHPSIFLGVLALLGASLMACTYTNQLPLIKTSRRFVFSVFLKGPCLYAYKGLAGRLAPVGVDIALLLIMAGGTLNVAGSFKGSISVSQGLNFVIDDVVGPTGFLTFPTEAFNTEIHVNRFYMDYYDSGELQVSEFLTDLSTLDMDGKEVMRKTISVNDPLRYDGITIYQTDWGISALQILKDNERPYNLAMALLQINGDKKPFGTFLPVGDINSLDVKGISMLARDLQSIVLYDMAGKFVGVRLPNSKLPIDINGTEIVIVDTIGSSGLDLKAPP
ncbi:hypothetical protein RJT34_31933 [Clitoria ternatea]|uniref:ResB-like domain-containing protein n=1 Tax=Clitoria ternatea TaxID=43366 RepID=A0AAN9I8W8_CLITE